MKNGNIKIDIQINENIYIEQYHNAIYLIMNGNDIGQYLFPLVNLICQAIEVSLKSFIAEPYYNEKTMKELKIDNTHNLKKLIEREELENIMLIYKRQR